MKLAEGIHRHGFRKWYERELLLGHAHMVLCFLCLIGVFATYEVMSQRGGLWAQPGSLVTMLMLLGVGLYALRRYLYLLSHVETVAHQAHCPACKTYGRLRLMQSDATGDEVRVRCKQCGHEWHISS